MRFMLTICLGILSAMFWATVTLSQGGSVDVSGEQKLVLQNCQRTGIPLWNCDCVLREFASARKADAKQSWHNLIAGVYARGCFDAEKIRVHYESVACPRMNRIQKATKKPETDCSCFGKSVAEKIVSSKTTSIDFIGKLAGASFRECLGR